MKQLAPEKVAGVLRGKICILCVHTQIRDCDTMAVAVHEARFCLTIRLLRLVVEFGDELNRAFQRLL